MRRFRLQLYLSCDGRNNASDMDADIYAMSPKEALRMFINNVDSIKYSIKIASTTKKSGCYALVTEVFDAGNGQVSFGNSKRYSLVYCR